MPAQRYPQKTMDDAIFRPLHRPTCDVACSHCNLREICLPEGLSAHELVYIDKRMVTARRRLARGETLYQAGDRCDALYAVWTGSFKTCINSSDGRSQVTGFQLSGELMGLDGIALRRHEVDAVALEDSQVCEIPVDVLELLASEVPSLQKSIHRVMSREIVRNQAVMLLLGSMYAEERLAAFLVNLIHRMHARGFSRSTLLLRMSREEIGSLLGLKLETVSRNLSRFQARGLIFVRNKQIHITDPVGLQQIVDGVGA
jgi:CRP/FNR family transcriptional regulator